MGSLAIDSALHTGKLIEDDGTMTAIHCRRTVQHAANGGKGQEGGFSPLYIELWSSHPAAPRPSAPKASRLVKADIFFPFGCATGKIRSENMVAARGISCNCHC